MGRKLAVLAAFLSACAAASSHAAPVDPSFRYRTLETPHFSVHFHQGLDDVAAKAASFAEEAHGRLAEAFRWSPAEKTQIVLVDGSDFTNGLAGALPYNAIYLYVVPPSIDLTIGEYDDWLRSVLVHEYAHVLTSDASRGYADVMRSIFGKPVPAPNVFSLLMFLVSAPPNTFLPRWWHEGMATWAETEATEAGRGRSVYYDMIFRMAVLDGHLPSIDQVNEDLPYWPDGHLPYLYGLRLKKYIVGEYGDDAPGALNRAHAGRFPYFLDGPPRRLSGGKGYKALFAEMIADLKREEEEKIERLKASPPTPVRTLPLGGEELTRPRFSPDGKRIAFNRRDPHRLEAIVVADADGTSPREAVRRLTSDRSVSWSPDGRTIYYCQAKITGGYNFYQDLYAYEAATGKIRRLTRDLRVSEPDASPDGERIAAVLSGRGSQNMAILAPRAGRRGGDASYAAEAVTDHRLSRVSGPRWSPGGERIAYVVTGNDGRSGLHVYDVGKKTAAVLFETGAPIATPAWSADGRRILYSSGETGVYNLFACSVEDGTRRQVTHLLGGAFHPDVSGPGGMIAFSSYGSKGFSIATVAYDEASWRTDPGPSIEPYRHDRPPGGRGAGETGVPEGSGEPVKAGKPVKAIEAGDRFDPADSKGYSSLATLAPRFWLPTLAVDHEGAVPGALTAGRDVLGYHAYVLEAAYGPGSRAAYGSARYVYDRHYPTFSAQGYSLPFLYSDLAERGDYFERNSGLILTMTVPYYTLSSTYGLSVGYQLQSQKRLSDLVEENLADIPVFEGRRDNLFAGIEYTNAYRFPYSISLEKGRTVSLTYKYYSTRLGSDLDSREYIASYEEYRSLPSDALRHHVVYLNLRGGVSSGNRTVQNAFQLGGPPSGAVGPMPTLGGFPLRGYPSRFETGKYVATGTIEYRAPLRYVFRGPGTAPVFLDRVHGAVFVDAGEAWNEGRSFSAGSLKVGAGIEARVDLRLGYWLGLEPAIGFAYGFDEDGKADLYFVIRAF